MPFTIGGEWAPSETPLPKKGGKPVKVRTERRGQAVVTLVLNLQKDHEKLQQLGARLRKRCGTGGTVKDGVIEIQGDKVKEVRLALQKEGIQAQG